MALARVTVPSGVILQDLSWSISSGTYLFSEILIVEHTKVESWHDYLYELEANVFLQKFPCLEQIRTWILLACDWSKMIQVRNLWNSVFQNEASDVIAGYPTAVHLNLTNDPVVVSPRSSRWPVQSPWSPPEQLARSPVHSNVHACVEVSTWKCAVQTGDQAMPVHIQPHSK